MTTAQTPGWTGHIAVDSALVMLDRIDCSPDDDARIDAITATLRQLHAAYQALQTENERLQMELVAEARAAAEQKLRADQLAQQHRMQAQMHAQATQQLAELEARKPLPLSDEHIDAIADGMPGGLGGFMKTWGWRQFARKILDLRAPPTWEPQFDAMAPGQEELAVQFCAEIAGPRGKPGRNPDPVRLLEMAEALYQAEFRDHQQTRHAPTQQEIHHA